MSSYQADEAAQDGSHYNRDVDSQTLLLQKELPKSASIARQVSLLLQDWWLWEILSAITAILATTAIIFVLVLYDRSSLPDWPSVFTVCQGWVII